MKAETSSILDDTGKAVYPAASVFFTPMGTLKDRLHQAMKLRHKEVADLVRATGLSKAAIHFVLNGTTKAETIRAVNVDKFCDALRVSREWLLYGRGTPDSQVGGASQSVGIDPAMLIEADKWVVYDETTSGAYSPDERMRRLALVYAVIAADGGHLSPSHSDEFIKAAATRKQQTTGERNNGRSTSDGRGGN